MKTIEILSWTLLIMYLIRFALANLQTTLTFYQVLSQKGKIKERHMQTLFVLKPMQ
jgi:hypothetical protein